MFDSRIKLISDINCFQKNELMAKTVRTITKEVENIIVVPKTILITQPKPEKSLENKKWL